MSLLDLPGLGNDFQSQLTTTQVPVVLGASGTYAVANNIATLTFTSAHGLTFSPAAGTMPNYFCTFSGASAQTGGVLNSNVFRILSIPSTTTITIYSTLSAATVTGASLIPLFSLPFTSQLGSTWAGMGGGFLADVTGGSAWAQLGPNASWKINTDSPSTAIILDQFTTPSTGTPATAPTWADAVSASTKGFVLGGAPQAWLWAGGTAGTTTVSVLN